jgi:hypothetical protein
MGRRRREQAPEGAEPQVETDSGPGPQGTLTLRGSADDLAKQLGVGEEKPKPEVKPPANGADDEKRKFVEALRNPKYIIRVKRVTPREFNGQKANVEVWTAELPLGYQEIQEEVAKACGGQKYRVAVLDPASNNTIAADTFEVEGDPIGIEEDLSEEERDRLFMHGKPKTAAEVTVEGLNRRAELSAKLLEVEHIESQLEEARKRRDNQGKVVPQDNSRVDELERRLTEAKHQAELEARDRRHAEEMRELKALIAQNAQPKSGGAGDPMMILLEQMREDRKQAQTQFTAILTQMKDDKLNTVIEELKTIKNRPQPQNNMLEMAETMLKLNKMITGVRGEDDEDDDDDDDSRPWWERAIDKLGGKFGDKFLDKLMDKFNGMEGKGEQVTREQFIKDLQDEAQRVADEAVAKAQQPRALPAPPSTLPPPPPAIPTASASALPPPPPAVATPPAANLTPAPEVPQKLTLEQEISIRVIGVLEIITREMELRPNEYRWNYEGAFLSLPEAVLEKVCAAPDPAAMVDAFEIPGINPDAVRAVKEKISSNARMMAWLKIGLDELKLWYAEKLKDPSFDPFEGEEETGEEA